MNVEIHNTMPEKTKTIVTLTYEGEEYIKVSDVIDWLKSMQSQSNRLKGVYHYLIKCLIKMKNSPSKKS